MRHLLYASMKINNLAELIILLFCNHYAECDSEYIYTDMEHLKGTNILTLIYMVSMFIYMLIICIR